MIKTKPITLYSLLAILFIIQLCHTCYGGPNPYAIINADVQKVQSHQFGSQFVYKNSKLEESYYSIKVWGTSCEAGVAYGCLMRNEIQLLMKDVWCYYKSLVEEQLKFITKVPEQLQPMPRAMAIRGKATKKGNLFHLRALDWDAKSPINQYPTLVFYNLVEKGFNPFVNVGWAGFVGSLTGFGVGEQVRQQKPAKENQTRIGKPWTYALRDVLQFSETIDDALNSLNKTRRTCSIHDQQRQEQQLQINKLSMIRISFILKMDDVVSMPIHDDKNYSCFNDLLKAQYGNIDEQWIVNTLAPTHQNGDTQMAAYNFNTKILIFQVSNKKFLTFQRSIVRINLAPFFAYSHSS